MTRIKDDDAKNTLAAGGPRDQAMNFKTGKEVTSSKVFGTVPSNGAEQEQL